jgi:hypothetical protein
MQESLMLESVLAGLVVVVLPCLAISAVLVDAIRSAIRRRLPALATGHGPLYQVVGTEHCRETLKRRLAAAPGRHFMVRLVPAPEDPYDPHAVAVCDADGATLAYLAAEDAPSYGRILTELHARGVEPVCSAKLVGGGGDGSALDLRLDLDQPLNIARRFRISIHHAGPGCDSQHGCHGN